MEAQSISHSMPIIEFMQRLSKLSECKDVSERKELAKNLFDKSQWQILQKYFERVAEKRGDEKPNSNLIRQSMCETLAKEDDPFKAVVFLCLDAKVLTMEELQTALSDYKLLQDIFSKNL